MHNLKILIINIHSKHIQNIMAGVYFPPKMSNRFPLGTVRFRPK